MGLRASARPPKQFQLPQHSPWYQAEQRTQASLKPGHLDGNPRAVCTWVALLLLGTSVFFLAEGGIGSILVVTECGDA